MSLVEIKKLTFEVGQTKILDDLNLTIGFQEIHALLGANGSGKSTLAYVLMGFEGYRPSSGEILFDGKDIGSLQTYERAQLGMTLAWQEPARFEGITVDQYVRLGRDGIDPGVYLRAVGLSPEVYAHRMVDKSLSGGERKRIELASVLALKPRLAILDEPASGIDMLSVQEIIAVIRAFRDEGASVLLITHVETIGLIADRASQLCAGKIIATGDPKEIADQYKKGSCVRCDGQTCLPSVSAMPKN